MSRKKTHSKYLGRPRKGSPLYAVQAKRRSYSRLSKALAVVAVIVLAVGIDVVVSQQEANDAANARAEKLVAAANHGQKNGVPATTPISDAQFNAYTVGP
ncbi:MAG TPA: hypothetical protein VGS28_03125, partial [Candidatus Saccharimonadales bacterium]|nr:hypothetical protein [Candidatus Saccharimonadales bacterium]